MDIGTSKRVQDQREVDALVATRRTKERKIAEKRDVRAEEK